MTAQKRQQALDEIPMSLVVVTPEGTAPGGVGAGSRELGLSVEGIAVTNLGPGRNREFIRGVADSPFSGVSQSTVAVQLDEARVIFDAPDPDLRLVDIERVEILKGPQGPLYGSGALGGIYHLVTRKPQLDKTTATAQLLTEARRARRRRLWWRSGSQSSPGYGPPRLARRRLCDARCRLDRQHRSTMPQHQ